MYSNMLNIGQLPECQSTIWNENLRTAYKSEFSSFNSFILELKPQTADCERLFSIYGFIKTAAKHRMNNDKMAVQGNIKIILRKNYKRENNLGNTYKSKILELGEREVIQRKIPRIDSSNNEVVGVYEEESCVEEVESTYERSQIQVEIVEI